MINFVTDKKFEGFKMNAQTGLSTYVDMGQVLFQTAAGTAFAGGRGHFEVAGEYAYNDGLLPRYPVAQQHSAQPNIGGRTLARESGIVSYGADGTAAAAAPAGQPRSLYTALTQGTQTAAYGLITSGPAAYTTFDASGRAEKYDQPVAASPAPRVRCKAPNGTCIGTPSDPGDQNDSREFTQGLYDPITRGNLYARVSYDLSPSAEIYATMNYGISRTQNTPAQGNSDKSGMTLRCDNAYLPSTGLFNTNGAGGQAAVLAGQSQIQANCLAQNPGNATNYTWSDLCRHPRRPADVHHPPAAPLCGWRRRHLRPVRQDLEPSICT